MPNLTQYVNTRGFELGLYTDSGTYTCSTGGRPFLIPGSYGYYAQDAATFASWGVRYVKMDWCNTDINGTQASARSPHGPHSARTLTIACHEPRSPPLSPLDSPRQCSWTPTSCTPTCQRASTPLASPCSLRAAVRGA